jgi:hypothetical protein
MQEVIVKARLLLTGALLMFVQDQSNKPRDE